MTLKESAALVGSALKGLSVRGSSIHALPPQRVAACGEIALALLLAFVSAQLFWIWASPAGPSGGLSGAPAAAVAIAPAPPLAASLTFDPFHRDRAREEAAPSAVAVQEDAPETALDLKLYGVRAEADPTRGSAIIRTPDSKQGAYSVGMSVLDEVTLAGVFADRVVLARGEAQESLYLDDAKRPAAPSRRAASAPARHSQNSTTVASAPQRPAPQTVAAVRPADTSGAAAQSPVDLSDVPALFRSLGLKPQVGPNGMNGLYVAPSGDAKLLAMLGLQQGDVVTAVDGLALDNVQKLSKVHERLEEGEPVSLEVLRAGRTTALEVDMAELRP